MDKTSNLSFGRNRLQTLLLFYWPIEETRDPTEEGNWSNEWSRATLHLTFLMQEQSSLESVLCVL